jgi:hypothetical protein
LSGIFLYILPIGPHIRATPAASLAGKPRLQIGQADLIRPLVAGDRRPMRAMIVAAIDQQAAHVGGAHLGKGDFLRAGWHGHGGIIAPTAAGVKPLDIGLCPARAHNGERCGRGSVFTRRSSGSPSACTGAKRQSPMSKGGPNAAHKKPRTAQQMTRVQGIGGFSSLYLGRVCDGPTGAFAGPSIADLPELRHRDAVL